MKNDVVTLPLAWSTRGVHQRRILAVNGGGLTIRVGLVFVGIQYLNFIQAHQKNTAVAAPLAFALRGNRLGKFDMQLAVAERLPRVNVAGLRNGFEIAALYFPFRGTAIFVRPFQEIFSVKKHDGIGWWTPRRVLRARRSRINDCRQR